MVRRKQLISNTSLFAGEGQDDVRFLNHIKTLYMVDGGRIRIINGAGGSPMSVVKKMVKRPEFFDYNRRFVLLDDDRAEIVEAIEYATKVGIYVIKSETCLEYEQLKVLGISSRILNRAKGNSKLAKEEFHNYMSKYGFDFDKIFPRQLLEDRRKSSAWLDEIIRVFEDS